MFIYLVIILIIIINYLLLLYADCTVVFINFDRTHRTNLGTGFCVLTLFGLLCEPNRKQITVVDVKN